jgi:ubiquinone/menaquinone biosynthesis C-methylase UbiE
MDPSLSQLVHAPRTDGVRYVAMTAEDAALADRSVDVITVAQALHWFDLARFYSEVRRVLMPGGTITPPSFQCPETGHWNSSRAI